MSKRAWVYVLGSIFTGLVLSLTTLWGRPPTPGDWITLISLATLGTLTQQFKAQFYKKKQHSESGSTNYSPILVFDLAGVIVLPPSLYVLLVLAPLVVEWVA